MANEWKYQRVDVATDLTTVESVACLVKGVYINTTLSAHPVEITDGGNNAFTIPASATAGNAYDFNDVRYETGLRVDPDNAGTGNLSVIYVILGESHG